MKTVKFAEVVKRCGEPSIYLAWVDPAKDKTLKRALNEHRVMTLHQELHGGKKDFGSVGFLKDRHAQLLVFPKSLRKFSERKVIAIDYSLIAKAPSGGAEIAALKQTKKERSSVALRPAAEPARSPESRKVKSENKVSPRPKPRPGETDLSATPTPPSAEKIMVEVKRAVAELGAGKSVPAYERLKRLVEVVKAGVT